MKSNNKRKGLSLPVISIIVLSILSFFVFRVFKKNVHGVESDAINQTTEKKHFNNVAKHSDIITVSVDGIEFNMIRVNGGSFLMGGTEEQGKHPESDEKPVHEVNLSSFYIGQTEVTQNLWTKVMKTTIEEQAKKEDDNTYGIGDDYPMYFVSWEECQTFVKRLSEMTDMSFRLPTEAEWEYAAKGGDMSKRTIFSGGEDAKEIGWFNINSGLKTHPVGQLTPNELGLYDMSGNVWEWCQDRYGAKYYKTSHLKNPQGPQNGFSRVTRGGSWANEEWFCRTTVRDWDFPNHRDCFIGFRLVSSESNTTANE